MTAKSSKPTPRPLRTFAMMGKFAEVPRAPFDAQLAKLLALVGSKRDAMVLKLPELPATAHVHRGRLATRLPCAPKAKATAIHIVDGDLACPSLSLDGDDDALVVVTGSLTVPILSVQFPITLVVGGNLTADYVAIDTAGGFAVAGTTTAKKIFLYADYNKPHFGKQPAGVVHRCEDHDVIKDVEQHVLWKRMLTGKRFLFDVVET